MTAQTLAGVHTIFYQNNIQEIKAYETVSLFVVELFLARSGVKIE